MRQQQERILPRKSLCSRCRFGTGKNYRCKHPKRQTDGSHVIRLWKCALSEKVRDYTVTEVAEASP